jgi:hypothetical protein
MLALIFDVRSVIGTFNSRQPFKIISLTHPNTEVSETQARLAFTFIKLPFQVAMPFVKGCQLLCSE